MAKTRTDYLTHGHDIALKEYASPSGFTAICAGLPLKGDKLSWQQQATLDGYERAREYLSQPRHRGTNHALEFVLSDAPLDSLNKLGGAMLDYSGLEDRVVAMQGEPLALQGVTTGRLSTSQPAEPTLIRLKDRPAAKTIKDLVVGLGATAVSDMHAEKAAEMFGVPVSEVTPEQRKAGKSDNFLKLYSTARVGMDLAAPGTTSQATVSYVKDGRAYHLTQDGNLLRDSNGVARGAISDDGVVTLLSPSVLEHLRILREQITGSVDEKRLSRLTRKVSQICQRHRLPV